jgi:hypothetical protein
VQMKIFAHARSSDSFQFMTVNVLDEAQWSRYAQDIGTELQGAVEKCDDSCNDEKGDGNGCGVGLRRWVRSRRHVWSCL